MNHQSRTTWLTAGDVRARNLVTCEGRENALLFVGIKGGNCTGPTGTAPASWQIVPEFSTLCPMGSCDKHVHTMVPNHRLWASFVRCWNTTPGKAMSTVRSTYKVAFRKLSESIAIYGVHTNDNSRASNFKLARSSLPRCSFFFFVFR